MDEVSGKSAGRFKISITDSTMMRILHTAMDKAHERAKSKEGVIERLNEISKFYELAVMQLEGCLKFVQEETDNGFDSSEEEVLGDLTEIRDRLQGRLKEADLAISEKDRELNDRLENELKLRQALELNERELDSLRANLELERTKSEGIEELILANRVSVDEDRDEEFSELKNSVNQQVWNIKQKLDPDYKLIDKRRNRSFNDARIEQMSSDIDILKETMDVAFGKMQSAIFLSELEPIEQQWTWTIEKDAVAMLIKGFMEDIEENFLAEVTRQEKQFLISLSKHSSYMETELACLRDELETLSTLQSHIDFKFSLKTNGKYPTEEGPDDSAERVDKGDQKKLSDEDAVDDEDGGHHVSKMIKNHESIIRRKSEEMNWLKREIMKEKESSNSRREKDAFSPRRIQEIIERLENLINWNAKLGENFGQYGDVNNNETYSKKMSCNLIMTEQAKSQFKTLEDVWKKVNQNSASNPVYEELHNQIMMLVKEKDDTFLQAMITETIYVNLLEAFVHESRIQLHCHSLDILTRETMYQDSLKMIVAEWKGEVESDRTDVQIREEIYCTVFVEAVKGFGSMAASILLECQNAKAKNNSLEDHKLEERFREEMSGVLLREICKDWNEIIERYETEAKDFCSTADLISADAKAKSTSLEDFVLEERFNEETLRVLIKETCKEWSEAIERCEIESLIKEKIYQVVFAETIKASQTILSKFGKGVKHAENYTCGFPCRIKSLECVEYIVKEDINVIFFKEMCKEWKEERDAFNCEVIIREDLYLVIIQELAKEATTCYEKPEMQENLRIFEDFKPDDKLCTSVEASRAKILTQKQDSLQKFITAGEEMIKTESSEIKEYDAQLHLVGLRHENKEKFVTAPKLLTEMKISSSSVRSTIEKALRQLALSKEVLFELRCNLGIAVDNTERFDYEMSPAIPLEHDTKISGLQPEENEDLNIIQFASVFNPIIEFFQVFVDFNCRIEEKLEVNILRLEEAVHHVNPLYEVVVSLKAKEWLYRKAFNRRCENLRKAETEVDLLGDQVEVLLGLLEKIYKTLDQYSPVLQQHFEVSDILNMIKKELIGRSSCFY